MHSTTIKIDGAKLKAILEKTTNKTIYQVALENGYSKNIISNAIKSGYASSSVQNIARIYGINPDAYAYKEPEPTAEAEKVQLSIDDLAEAKREELKALIKETIIETLSDCSAKEVYTYYDKELEQVIITLRLRR